MIKMAYSWDIVFAYIVIYIFHYQFLELQLVMQDIHPFQNAYSFAKRDAQGAPCYF